MDRKSDASPTDEELVSRIRAGDGGAFDSLVLRYRKEIYRIAYRMTGDHAEADDLAQETFCRAFTGLAEFRGESSVRTWLFRIVSNLSLNVVQSARVARRDAVTIETLAQAGRPATVQEPAGFERLVARQHVERLRLAIATLPRKQRTTLILRAFEGLQYKEIARAMGCSIGTAKANFFHAISSLRRELKDIL